MPHVAVEASNRYHQERLLHSGTVSPMAKVFDVPSQTTAMYVVLYGRWSTAERTTLRAFST